MTERTLNSADLQEVLTLLNEAKETLKKRRINQWQGDYPALEDLLEVLESDECFALTKNGRIAAFTRLSRQKQVEYENLTGGAWLTQGLPYATLHRTVVAAAFRSRGVSDLLLDCAQKRAKAYGCKSIRVDTHPTTAQ